MDPAQDMVRRFAIEHPSQAAVELDRAPAPDVAAFLASLGPALAASLLQEMGPVTASACLAVMKDGDLGPVAGQLPPERLAALLRRASAATVDRVLATLPAPVAEGLRSRLTFAEDSVGALADPSVVAFPPDTVIDDVTRHLLEVSQSCVYVISRTGQRLIGVVDADLIWQADPGLSLHQLMEADVLRLASRTSLDRALEHPGWREHDILPVVDSDGRFLGALRHRSLRRWQESRFSGPASPSPLGVLMNLSELYVTSLTGLATSLGRPGVHADPASPAAGADHGS